MLNKLLAIGILIPLLILIAPNVYGKHLSDTKRYNDGYSNGSDAAARDSTYNVACDPTGAYTSDGQHSTTYCDGWANGYTATWNSNHAQTTNPQQQTCADGTQPDSNGNCPSSSSQSQSSSNTGLGDKVCKLVNSGEADALGTLLLPLHIITGGTTSGILAAGHLYCALHGSSRGN